MRNLVFLALLATARAGTWPAEVVADGYDVRLVSEDRATGAATYASARFAIASDIKLPLGVVRDLAAVFEATRAAVRAAPLGLSLPREPNAYRVRLIARAEDYGAAGGGTGSGGFFNGREMLILLPNLGIQSTTNGLSAQHQRHLFVLKHEVTHQVMAGWGPHLPVWVNEGLAETFAAVPYTRGRYTFQNLDAAMREYLLKWRTSRDTRRLAIIGPPRLMAMTPKAWGEAVGAQRAYDLYNSAALLTHYFIRHDGAGDSAGLAAFLLAIREGGDPDAAESEHLLRGRTREQLTAELQKLTRKMAIDATFE